MTNQLHIKGLEASVAALMQQVAELELENARLQEALKRNLLLRCFGNSQACADWLRHRFLLCHVRDGRGQRR